MGNITFTDEDASSLTPEAREHLDVVADCFQLDADKLAEEMVLERIMMGAGQPHYEHDCDCMFDC